LVGISENTVENISLPVSLYILKTNLLSLDPVKYVLSSEI
jgi:hypothetical protein